MPTELKRIVKAERKVLEHLFQYYLYDMTHFSGWPVSNNGKYKYPRDLLPPYWEKNNHHPYFIFYDNELAGFCLVRRSPMDNHIWDMGQFFVLRKFRKKGVGRSAFAQALSGRNGQWQIRILPSNLSAYQFWKNTIEVLTGGVFIEEQKKYYDLDMIYLSFKSSSISLEPPLNLEI